MRVNSELLKVKKNGVRRKKSVGFRVRKVGRKSYSKGEKDRGGRQLDEQERVKMRLSVGEGRREGQTLCFPTLGRFPQWTRLIPVLIGGEFQRTCSPGMSVERRERGESSGASDTSDRPQRLGLVHSLRGHFVGI